MTRLDSRLVRLERAANVGGEGVCSCGTYEILFRDHVEHEASPLCPHGRPWSLIRQYDLREGQAPLGESV